MKIKRLIRAASHGSLLHWQAPKQDGVALCGISPVGRTSGVFDVLPYGQLQNPYNGVITLVVDAVDCPECATRFAELIKGVNLTPAPLATAAELPSRARFEAAQAAAPGEDAACEMCSG